LQNQILVQGILGVANLIILTILRRAVTVYLAISLNHTKALQQRTIRKVSRKSDQYNIYTYTVYRLNPKNVRKER